jgi:hypothetical protein
MDVIEIFMLKKLTFFFLIFSFFPNSWAKQWNIHSVSNPDLILKVDCLNYIHKIIPTKMVKISFDSFDFELDREINRNFLQPDSEIYWNLRISKNSKIIFWGKANGLWTHSFPLDKLGIKVEDYSLNIWKEGFLLEKLVFSLPQSKTQMGIVKLFKVLDEKGDEYLPFMTWIQIEDVLLKYDQTECKSLRLLSSESKPIWDLEGNELPLWSTQNLRNDL